MVGKFNVALSCLLLLSTCGQSLCSYVGAPCTGDFDCRDAGSQSQPLCEDRQCVCEAGYYGLPGQVFCTRITLGTPCPDDDAGFCPSGVTDSICSPRTHVCECPEGSGWVWTNADKPFCAVRELDNPQCDVCDSLNDGVCFRKVNSQLTCGCPCQFDHSDKNNPLLSGCDQKWAFTGQTCNKDVVCIDDHAECSHDGKLTAGFTCTCKTGFVPIRYAANPRFFTCVPKLSADVEPDCSTCIANGGRCYSRAVGIDTMEGCLCPLGRTSRSERPEDACAINHFEIECGADGMTVCLKSESVYSGVLASYQDKFVEGQEDFLSCHLKKQPDEDRWCIKLLYKTNQLQSELQPCGMQVTDSKLIKSYSVWIMYTKSNTSANDACVYNYCSYHKTAKSHTGHIEVDMSKLVTATGFSVRPEVEMGVTNKYNQDVEVKGALLGEFIRLSVTITNTKDVYVTLRAEVCVASSMMSLSHPAAETAVFIMDSLPRANNLMGPPNVVFTTDPTNKLRILTNFFPLSKFSSDVVFFHCLVRVCIEESNCAPKTARRRKRSTGHSSQSLPTSQDRSKRSLDQLLTDHQDDPELLTKTIGVVVKNPAGKKVQITGTDDIEERIIRALENAKDQAAKAAAADYYSSPDFVPVHAADNSTNIVVFLGVFGTLLLTLLIGLLIFLVYFVLPEREARMAAKKVKGDDDDLA